MQQQPEILLVEDTLTQAMRISHILSTKYKVTLARSGSEALDKLSTCKPHLILSDINMPEMDGYQLCARVKEMPECSTIPFVLMIFPLDGSGTVNIINCGADDLVGKIFDSDYLLGRLSNILDIDSEQRSQSGVDNQSAEGRVNGDSGRDTRRLGQLLASAMEIVAHYNRAND